MQTTLNIPLGRTRQQQLQDLADIKEAIINSIFNHPGVNEVINDDPQAKQLSLIYFTVHDHLRCLSENRPIN